MEKIALNNIESIRSRGFLVYEDLKEFCKDEINKCCRDFINKYKKNRWKIYSAVNPNKTISLRVGKIKEILGGTEEDIILLIGFGLGFEIEELLKSRELNDKRIIIVTTPEMFIYSICKRDMREILNCKRIINIAFSDHRSIRKLFEAFEEDLISNNIKIVNLRIPYESEIVENKLKEHKRSIAIKWKTKELLINIIVENLSKNIPYFNLNPNASIFFNRFDQPAVVVSGGPSLDNDIETLKEIQDKAIIIAISASLKPLLKQGILPHFVLYIDPTYKQYDMYLKGVKVPEETIVCLTPAVNWKFYEHGIHRILSIFSRQDLRVFDLFSRLILNKEEVYGGGSVAINAFNFAVKITKGPVILVAQDLAYPLKGSTHARYSGKSNEIEIRKGDPRYIWIKGNYDDLVPSDELFVGFRNLFTIYAKAYKDRVLINATSGGAFIDGFEVARLTSDKVQSLFRNSKVYRRKILEIYDKNSSNSVYYNMLKPICEKTSDIILYYIKTFSEENDKKLDERRIMLLLYELMKKDEVLYHSVLELAGLERKYISMFNQMKKGSFNYKEFAKEMSSDFLSIKRSLIDLEKYWNNCCKKILIRK